MEPLYSLQEAARILGIARSTLYLLIDSGELETVKIKERRLVEPSALRALIDAGRQRREVIRS